MLLKASEAFFFFFIISSSSLISHQAHHPSDLSHQALISTQPPPSPAPAPAVTIASPSPSRRRPTPSTLTSLPHRCRPTHAFDPLRRSKPLTHLPTLPSQTHVIAAPPPCSPHRPSPRLSPRPSPSPTHFRSVRSLHF